jgi:hypothetical protein
LQLDAADFSKIFGNTQFSRTAIHRPEVTRQTLNSIGLHAVNLSSTCLQAEQFSSPTSSPLTAFAALL